MCRKTLVLAILLFAMNPAIGQQAYYFPERNAKWHEKPPSTFNLDEKKLNEAVDFGEQTGESLVEGGNRAVEAFEEVEAVHHRGEELPVLVVEDNLATAFGLVFIPVVGAVLRLDVVHRDVDREHEVF